MEVFVKTGAIDKYQMDKEVSKPEALKLLKKLHHQEEVKATDSWYRTRVDVSEAAKNARNYQRNLDRVTPETLTSANKDRMWKQAKLLKDQFIIGMLSQDDLHPVRGFLENGVMKWVVDESRMHATRAIERNSAWYRKNDRLISEYKNLMRHLCPEDPNAGDIEKFRPKKMK